MEQTKLLDLIRTPFRRFSVCIWLQIFSCHNIKGQLFFLQHKFSPPFFRLVAAEGEEPRFMKEEEEVEDESSEEEEEELTPEEQGKLVVFGHTNSNKLVHSSSSKTLW